VISGELKPLEQLVFANNTLEVFEEKLKKGEEVPNFRLEAAREIFIRSLDAVSGILFKCKAIEKVLDTALMLSRFEIANWKNIRAYEFYISTLQKNYQKFRDELRNLFKIGKSKHIVSTKFQYRQVDL
jgi:hypothetical protein